MTDAAQVREIVRQVVERTRHEAGPAGPPRDSRFVTADEVATIPRGGELVVPPGVRLTPLARDAARERNIQIGKRQMGQSPAAGSPQPDPAHTVAIGADHGGFALKEGLKKLLAELGYVVDDVGTHSTEAVDYPDFARPWRNGWPRAGPGGASW